MKNVALHNLGCKVNSYEIEVMQEKLEVKGYKIVPFAPGADIYVINTCTVTNIADRKSRQMLHKAKKMNPDAVVVAVGCYVQTGEKTVEKDPCIDLAIGNNRKKEIVEILEDFLEKRSQKTGDEHYRKKVLLDINDGHVPYEEMKLTKTAEHTRAYIKIQDGCNQFCTYCIIPFARGRVRSRKEEDILQEAKGLVEAGYKELVVTGIHLSSYGLDFITKDSEDYLQGVDIRTQAYQKGLLIDILEKIHDIPGLERLRIGSLEPRIITPYFAKRLKELPKVCPHFHLSLQSGCDATLKRMNRFYTAQEYKEKAALLREIYPEAILTTDIIVGFPGETMEEFEETVNYLEELNFYEMHVFKYSKREGTVAAERKDQISDQVKQERSERLIALAKEQSNAYRRQMIGKEVEVLIEEEKVIAGKKVQIGHTPTYMKAAVYSEQEMKNKIIKGIVGEIFEEEYLLLNF